MDAPSLKFGDILRRTALPFLVFAAVLAALLTLSWVLLIPSLTEIEIAGSVRGVDEIRSYRDQLQHDIAEIETRRNAFLMPVQSGLFADLRSMKFERFAFQEIRRELQSIAKNLVPDQKNAIVFERMHLDTASNTFTVTGEIRNVGNRSMTVLAQFVEATNTLESVRDISHSKYTRIEDPVHGFTSPFSLKLLLK